MTKIGEAAGLVLRMVGWVGRSAGRSAAEALIAAWASCAASSIWRERSNCTAIVVVPTALVEVMKGRTTFVIAHRLATVRNATSILLLQEGRIIESGSFDELTRQGGKFAELARTQFMVAETAKPTALSVPMSAAGS